MSTPTANPSRAPKTLTSRSRDSFSYSSYLRLEQLLARAAAAD